MLPVMEKTNIMRVVEKVESEVLASGVLALGWGKASASAEGSGVWPPGATGQASKKGSNQPDRCRSVRALRVGTTRAPQFWRSPVFTDIHSNSPIFTQSGQKK